jgi:hypothetical protein
MERPFRGINTFFLERKWKDRAESERSIFENPENANQNLQCYTIQQRIGPIGEDGEFLSCP